jgi:hypothetical protein
LSTFAAEISDPARLLQAFPIRTRTHQELFSYTATTLNEMRIFWAEIENSERKQLLALFLL